MRDSAAPPHLLASFLATSRWLLSPPALLSFAGARGASSLHLTLAFACPPCKIGSAAAGLWRSWLCDPGCRELPCHVLA